MRRFLAVGIAFGACLSMASEASAQKCLGAGSLNLAPFQLSGGLAFSTSARGVGASFRGGRDAFFGVAVVQDTTQTASNLSAPTFGGGIGANLATGTQGRVNVCPLMEVLYTTGPNIGNVTTSSLQTISGGQIGIVAGENGTVAIVPTIGAFLELVRTTAGTSQVSATATDHFGLARLGVGIIIHQQLAITPMLTVPFGEVGGETVFEISLSYNF